MSSRRTTSIRIGIDMALATALAGLLLSHLISHALSVLLSAPPWPPQLDGGQQVLPLLGPLGASPERSILKVGP